MSVSVVELERYLAELLQCSRVPDACPNGVQAEGGRPVTRLAAAVSASGRTIEAAATWGADALLVHHGLFWDRQPAVLRGAQLRRVRSLLDSGMSLFAYHLPLDVHATFGHSALIARSLGLSEPLEPFGAYKNLHLGWRGRFATPQPLETVLERAREALGGLGRVHTYGPDPLIDVAVASGDCPFLLREAARAGVELLLTGEETEWVQELARDEELHFVVGGHYRTEAPGVRALAAHLAERFKLAWTFVDVPNEA